MSETVSKTYIITDTHFDHEKMTTKFKVRPRNFTNKIINQWHATVEPHDIVVHLGDVIWGRQDRLSGIMNYLPGTKILVKGNHDRNHSNNWFIQAGFAAVFEKVQMSGIIFSHFPAILNQEEIDRGIINVFGHFHSNPPKRWEPSLKKRLTPNHFLLALENVEYRPIDLVKIKKEKFVQNALKLLESESKVN